MRYTDYCWKEGVPKGILGNRPRYEIISDPYGKRYLVTCHDEEVFLIYDSSAIDFRHLNPRHQMGWTRELLGNDRFLIRDRDHFPLFIEHHFFKDELPIECRFYSLSKQLVGTQKIHYLHFGAPFNGVTLYDIMDKPVIQKKYTIDDKFEFKELQSEFTSF